MKINDLTPLDFYKDGYSVDEPLVEKISREILDRIGEERPVKEQKFTVSIQLVGDEVGLWEDLVDIYEGDPRYNFFDYNVIEENGVAHQEITVYFTPFPDFEDLDLIKYILKDCYLIDDFIDYYTERRIERLIRGSHIIVDTADSFIDGFVEQANERIFNYDAWLEEVASHNLDEEEESELRAEWEELVDEFLKRFGCKTKEEFETIAMDAARKDLEHYKYGWDFKRDANGLIGPDHYSTFELSGETLVISFWNVDGSGEHVKFRF